MTDEEGLGLRERKALSTRRALSDAALELAFERGLENVRREDIAARAGVSIRTFNNYFAGKYDAIGYRQIERFQQSAELLRSYPAETPLWTAITAAMLAPLEAEGVTDPPNPTQLKETRKLLDVPDTHAVLIRRVLGADGELAQVIAERTGTDPVQDLFPRLVAGTIGIAFRSAFELYVHSDPPVSVVTLLRRALTEIAAGLPDPSAS